MVLPSSSSSSSPSGSSSPSPSDGDGGALRVGSARKVVHVGTCDKVAHIPVGTWRMSAASRLGGP